MEAPPAVPRRSRLDSLSRAYFIVIACLAVAMMALIVAIMGVQVFYRYVLNDSLIWAEEICRYLLILMTFLLIGAAFERGEMVSLHFFTSTLPPRIRLALMLPLYLLMIAFLLVLAWYGWRFALLNGRSTMPAIDFIVTGLTGREANLVLPLFWLYLAVPAGCIILALHFLIAVAKMLAALGGHGDPVKALPNSGTFEEGV